MKRENVILIFILAILIIGMILIINYTSVGDEVKRCQELRKDTTGEWREAIDWQKGDQPFMLKDCDTHNYSCLAQQPPEAIEILRCGDFSEVHMKLIGSLFSLGIILSLILMAFPRRGEK